MLVAYVDESYDESRYFVAAAIGDEFQWEEFKASLDRIRDRTVELHGLRPDIEFHAYELMGGVGDWNTLRGRHREAAGVYAAVLGAAKKARIRYVLRGLDLAKIRTRRGQVIDAHGETFMHVLEQVDKYTTKRRQTERTVVIADEIGTQSEHQKQFHGYQQFGTWGYQSKTLDRLEPPIRFRPSRSEAGLQLVDFAVYLHRRRESGSEMHPQARSTVDRLCKLLDPFTENRKMWPT